MAIASDVLVLATSAPADRVAYRRDLLNCMCFPDSISVHFTYRRKWIDPDVLANSPKEGDPVVIVLCDIPDPAHPDKGYGFLPIRHGRFTQFDPPNYSGVTDPDRYIGVKFQLGPIFRVDETTPVEAQRLTWQHWLEAYPTHPRPRGSSYSGQSHFVFRWPPPTEGTDLPEDRAWALIAEQIARARTLADCTLFRVAGMCQDESRACTSLPLVRYADIMALRLRAAKSYRLLLQYYLDPKRNSRPPEELRPSVSTESINTSRPLLESIGTSTRASIIVTCARVYESEVATLIIENPKDDEAKFPRAEFPVMLKPQRGLLILVLTLLVLGVLATGVSADTIEELTPTESWIATHANGVADAAKLVGGALVGLAGYLGFRKLPGGGG
jgi:hypothetical protein